MSLFFSAENYHDDRSVMNNLLAHEQDDSTCSLKTPMLFSNKDTRGSKRCWRHGNDDPYDCTSNMNDMNHDGPRTQSLSLPTPVALLHCHDDDTNDRKVAHTPFRELSLSTRQSIIHPDMSVLLCTSSSRQRNNDQPHHDEHHHDIESPHDLRKRESLLTTCDYVPNVISSQVPLSRRRGAAVPTHILKWAFEASMSLYDRINEEDESTDLRVNKEIHCDSTRPAGDEHENDQGFRPLTVMMVSPEEPTKMHKFFSIRYPRSKHSRLDLPFLTNLGNSDDDDKECQRTQRQQQQSQTTITVQ